MVTLKEVAREAGVSAHSVSAVLNGNADRYRISPATRERIEEMAQKLGYDPDNHRGARQMAARKHGVRLAHNVIAVSSISQPSWAPDSPQEDDASSGLLASSLHEQPYASEVLYGIEATAHQHRLDVLLCRHYENKLPRLVEKCEVDGVICLAANPDSVQQLTKLDIPCVMLVSACEGFHNVVAANAQGTYEAVRHLVGLGHKKIAYIGHRIAYDVIDSALLTASRERFAGYEQAMRDNGLPVEFTDISLYEQTTRAAGAAMDALWDKSRGEITAVVCYNDILAMGVIHSLKKRGLQVPVDVSVTGFDDISIQLGFEPRITSVRYDRFELGRRAVEMLWNARPDWLAGEERDFALEVLPVELKVRQSTAPPRHNTLFRRNLPPR